MDSIFYIGKATGRRDLMHLKDTILAIINWQDNIVKAGGKIYTCMRALLESTGIVIITGFYDSSHFMAHNREASLIDFIGLEHLTNVYRGSKYGAFSMFDDTKSKNYGMLSLYVMFRNYINNGPVPSTIDDLCFQKCRKCNVNVASCAHRCISCNAHMICGNE